MVRYLPLLLLLALWIHAFVDCLNTPDEQVRNLPKPVWILVILLFGEVLVGPVAWYAAGRPRPGSTGYAELPPEPSDWVAPDDNPEFLRSLSLRLRGDEAALREWEADLRRREEELRRRERDAGAGRGPDAGPTSGPTSGPASGPASGPTSDPGSGADSGQDESPAS